MGTRLHGISRLKVMSGSPSQLLPQPILAEPVRTNVGAAELAAAAERMALRHVMSSPVRRGSSLRKIATEDYERLRGIHERFSRAVLAREPVNAAAEWLLDNFHIIEAQSMSVARNLSRGFLRRLPRLADDGGPGWPRIFVLAYELITHTDAHVEASELGDFIVAYQAVTPLTMGELWALPIMLQIALLRNLRVLCEREIEVHQLTIEANTVADELLAQASEDGLTPDRLARAMRRIEETDAAFVIALLQRLHAGGLQAEPASRWIHARLALRGMEFERLVAAEDRREAAALVSIRNSITTMRVVSAMDWREFFERVSIVERELREDPTSAYAQNDFETRDRYRHVVETLARRHGVVEHAVAVQAVTLAKRASKPDARRRHVGYYLIGDGRLELESVLSGQPSQLRKFDDRLWRNRGTIAFIAIFVLTVGIMMALVRASSILHGANSLVEAAMVITLVILMSFVPATEIAICAVQWLAARFIKPQRLPKLDFSSEIPSECRTAVVVQGLLSSPKNGRELLERLEVYAQGNPQNNLMFGVLADLADAPSEYAALDGTIVEEALQATADLNQRAGGTDGSPRFFFLIRRRTFNPRDRVWTGWERKRGKIEEFNHWLRRAHDGSFIAQSCDATELGHIHFVITLDSDTRLVREAAASLIGAMAHPLNRPEHDEHTGVVQRGYAVLQPRIGLDIAGACRSAFSRIFSHQAGLDPYTQAVSDFYQDLFDRGIYTGKGIYDVDAFSKALRGQIPDQTVLSHDLLEGSYARAGLVSDIELVDEFPSNYLAWARRQHRWIRGDWQLLQWLKPRVRNQEGQRVPNPLGALARWQILDNLRRSVRPFVVVLILLLTTAGVMPGHPLVWLALAFLTIAFPISAAIAEAMLTHRGEQVRWSGWFANRVEEFAATTSQTLVILVMLPHIAWISVHAIGLTLWRLMRRRRLLEWMSAAATEAACRTHLGAFVRAMWICPVVAVGLVLASWLWNPTLLPVAIALFLLWAPAPVAAWMISRPQRARVELLSETDRRELVRIARKTWAYFERFAGEENHWLPADNFQLEPEVRLARRTSPTNIGMLLTSILCAAELQIITHDSLIERLEHAFSTLKRLERGPGGHFYNWYDLETLQPLMPRYVSTVDSGNLLGALVIMKQALRELSAADAADLRLQQVGSANDVDALRHRAERLAETADEWIQGMDFSVLYDRQRHLMSIGLNVQVGMLDDSHYDLLASEARLASFLAIALLNVPTRHWFRLNRTLTAAGRGRSLVSWGGTMFEYLMPLLFMNLYEGTLLDETCRSVLERQIEYGRERGVPWGVSESAFYALYANRDYHYKAHGVPGLGLKRALSEDVVISPYSTFLAMGLAPRRALDNLRLLIEEGAEGEFGLYEALDYTSERLPRGQRRAVVAAYMAHHQGMILAAIANTLCDNVLPRRFHADPAVRSAELLLEERTPRHVLLSAPHPAEVASVTRVGAEPAVITREFEEPYPPAIAGQLLGNGSYSVFVTTAGAGFSRWGEIAVNRWREDSTCERHGTFIFLRDQRTRRVWSAAAAPRGGGDRYRAIFSPHKAEFVQHDNRVETHLEVLVHPERNVEIRVVRLTNLRPRPLQVDLTTAVEVALAPQRQDVDHPTFGNLFLQTERLPGGLLCWRRPRSSEERSLFAVHVLAVEGDPGAIIEVESDRERFIGRNESIENPRVVIEGRPLSGTVGAVINPVLSTRYSGTVAMGTALRVAVITAVADSREEALHLAEEFRDFRAVQRAMELAWTHNQIEMRRFGLSSRQVSVFQEFAARLAVPHPTRRHRTHDILANRKGQYGLWPYAISGDWPIMLVRVLDERQQSLIRLALQAHRYFRARGLKVDLVFVNEFRGGYRGEVTQQIRDLFRASNPDEREGTPGGVFIREADAMPPEDLTLLRAVARIVLTGAQKPLDAIPPASAPPTLVPERAAVPVEPGRMPNPELVFANGYGGFTKDAHEYIIGLEQGETTPAPWINVVSNADFGFTVSETGAGYTWAINSRQNKLTSWSNDPVTDSPSEAIYIRDDQTGQFWSPTPSPGRDAAGYRTHHGQGYSTFHHQSYGIVQELKLFVPLNDPIKIAKLQLTNQSNRPRSLSVFYYAELALGSARDVNQAFVTTQIDEDIGVLVAINRYNVEFAERVAFLEGIGGERTFTGDRAEFIGRGRTLQFPEAMRRVRLSGRTGAGFDPVAAVQVRLRLAPGQTQEVTFLFGQGNDLAHVRELVQKYRDAQHVQDALQAVWDFWNERLDLIDVQTPDDAMNLMMNRWLLYQVLACRFWARTALYQASGAFGFRDQLQDAVALIYCAPHLCRAHLLRAAARMFEEGDVQHWWHPPGGQGVRTRCSDDLLWLPHAVAQYVNKIGDTGVLDELEQYLHDEPLRPDEYDRYNAPPLSVVRGTLYEHCCRALDRSLERIGDRGLPLIGTGDWNDGMNLVGHAGRGQSVWLAWFLATTLRDFAPFCRARGDGERADRYEAKSVGLAAAADRSAWDGRWYLRAFTDDGHPIGASSNEECRIDSIAQSWPVICGLGNAERARQAVASADELLLRRADQLCLLLAPPFDRSLIDPGYIKGYVPGVRENGGHYSHAACWMALAHALLGDGQGAVDIWRMINPVSRAATKPDADRYRVEPYVVAGDIYALSPHTGRGGWTWYTGAAGWLYRVALETILGLKLLGGKFRVEPCIPREWPEFTIAYRHYSSRYIIRVINPQHVNQGVQRVELDGEPLPPEAEETIVMADDGREHQVLVVLGTMAARH